MRLHHSAVKKLCLDYDNAPPDEESLGGGEYIDQNFRYTPIVDWERLSAEKYVANTFSLAAAWSRFNLGHQALHLEAVISLRDLLIVKLNSN